MAVWLGAPGEARALAVRAGKLNANPEKGDRFRVKGDLGDLSIDGAEQLLIAFDGAAVGLPLSEFKRKKRTLTYRGDGAAAVVARLTLDLRRRRFDVRGRGWVLAGLRNPFEIRLGTEQATSCAVVRLVAGGKGGRRPHGSVRFKLVTVSGGCGVLGIPRPDPVAVLAATPTQVRFAVGVSGAPDPGTVRLFRADPAGKTSGDALCVLDDNGSADVGDAVAGDGTFACRTGLLEPGVGEIAVVAEARVGGTRVVSPGLTLPVVAPFTTADAETIIAAQALRATPSDTSWHRGTARAPGRESVPARTSASSCTRATCASRRRTGSRPASSIRSRSPAPPARREP